MAKHPPLAFAKAVSDQANASWIDGSFLEKVTPTTRTLLEFWFDGEHEDVRDIHFHQGQRQAILNIIYLYEVLGLNTPREAYNTIAPHLLSEKGSGMEQLTSPTSTYNCPKYCVKMATGTGKTWVLEALVVWQYLNARHEDSDRYTKNFLIVAPGLIVYDRLLDAFCGRNEDNGDMRDFESSDLKRNQELFIPDEYREELFGFLQGSVVEKTNIGSAVTGDGIVAITNYHLLMGVEDKENTSEGWGGLPVSPGTSAGHGLDDLDRSLGDKRELEFLRNLPNLMVINDEAHHIHEVKKHGEVLEVEWQKSLRYIAETKGLHYMQLDFSATPYYQHGKEKIYFPHIVVDFELKTAIQGGLVKTVVLDERKELNTEALDYKVLRDERKKVIDLSDGQRQMLRAGIAKLNLLECNFADIDETKVPKMLVICEDTEVVPLVRDFLLSEGRDKDDILEIHSNKKGEVGQDEWEEMKQQLFALDRYKKPRIVISVLMLREGFDVNNICVIVPLRSTTSGILLEQTIGRGLRLMWRGNDEIDELKQENRHRILVEKKTATNYFDVLSVVEHPAFREFYQNLIDEGIVGVDDDYNPDNDPTDRGEILRIGLKPDYEKYDFRVPTIIQEAIEIMKSPHLDVNRLSPMHISLVELQKIVPDNEQWISTEITEKTHFGDFDVVSGVFQATSYNDYLMRLVNRIIDKLGTPVDKVSQHRRSNDLPGIALDAASVARLADQYIRTKLFNQVVDPQLSEVWKVLRLENVINHIASQLSILILETQEQTEVSNEAEVIFNALSSVDCIIVREKYSIEPVKCIYEMLPYPSNKGLYEKEFCEFADNDGGVDAFCKVIESKHTFLRFRYVREDGLPAIYIPDFLVRFGNDIYLVETKAQDQLTAENVKRKQRSACNWVDHINKLSNEKREGMTWHYAILGDETFYNSRNRQATLRDMLKFAELRNTSIISPGKLF